LPGHKVSELSTKSATIQDLIHFPFLLGLHKGLLDRVVSERRSRQIVDMGRCGVMNQE
jgi:hypothetical protein